MVEVEYFIGSGIGGVAGDGGSDTVLRVSSVIILCPRAWRGKGKGEKGEKGRRGRRRRTHFDCALEACSQIDRSTSCSSRSLRLERE